MEAVRFHLKTVLVTTIYRSGFRVVTVVLDITGVEVIGGGTFSDSESDSS